GQTQDPIELESEVRLAEKQESQAGIRQASPATVLPSPIVLLEVQENASAVPIPIEALQRTEPQRDADALERPKEEDVGLGAGAPRVSRHGAQSSEERWVFRKGGAPGPGRLMLREARSGRGNGQGQESGAGHRLGARPPGLIPPSPIFKLGGAEMGIDRL